jgi:hypothetical protein
MRFMAALFVLMTMSWVVACTGRDPVADNAVAANVPASINDPAPTPEGGPPPANEPQVTPASTTAAAAIPASLQGSWGLTPADCTSTRSDAKGLLVITAADLKFYESRAVPSPGVTADSDSITGNLAFTGEGQSWTKFETFERQKDRLVRTESNPAASYSYAKC